MAEPLLDVAAQRRLQALVKKATDKRQFSSDPDVLRDIKGMCRVDEANVRTAFDAISEALKATHAQASTRLLAVELTDVLFQRSRVFRGLLAPRLTAFLVAAVGYRQEEPLPGPEAAAAALRERALEVLEAWNDKFGGMYHQVSLGCSYLKTTLKYDFPEVAGRAAAERARQQAAANEAYARVAPDFEPTMSEVTSTLTQMEEAMALVEAPTAAAAAEDADMGWTDVGAGAGAAGIEDEDAGLSAYAVDDPPAAEQEGAGAPAPTAPAVDPALAQTLLDLQRLLTGGHLRTLRRWLDIFAKARPADPGAAGSEARRERDRRLRQVLDQRAHVDTAMARLGAARVRLPALATALEAAAAAHAPAAAAGAGRREIFKTETEVGTAYLARRSAVRVQVAALAAEDTAQAARGFEHRLLKYATMEIGAAEGGMSAVEAAAAARAAAAGLAWSGGASASAGGRTDGPAPPSDEELLESARRHAALQDPAAPRSKWTLDGRFSGKSAAAPPPAAAVARAAAAAVAARPASPAAGGSTKSPAGSPARRKREAGIGGGGNLPEDVKRKLLQSAPVVAAGGHLSYWDSGSGSASAARSGMEISNHWGPVNHDAQINLAQLEDMAVNHVPEYYTPSKGKGKGLPAAAAAATPPHADKLERPAASRPAPVTRIGGGATVMRPGAPAPVTYLGGSPFPSHLGALSSSGAASGGARSGDGASAARPAAPSRCYLGFRAATSADTSLLLGFSGARAAVPGPELAAAEKLAALVSAAAARPPPAATASPAAPHEPRPGVVGGPQNGRAAGGGAARAEAQAGGDGTPNSCVAAVADRRAARQHNNAVLAGARSDEEVARALEAEEGGGAKKGQKRKGKQESLYGRLSKKLAAAETRSHDGPKHSVPGRGHHFGRF